MARFSSKDGTSSHEQPVKERAVERMTWEKELILLQEIRAKQEIFSAVAADFESIITHFLVDHVFSDARILEHDAYVPAIKLISDADGHCAYIYQTMYTEETYTGFMEYQVDIRFIYNPDTHFVGLLAKVMKDKHDVYKPEPIKRLINPVAWFRSEIVTNEIWLYDIKESAMVTVTPEKLRDFYTDALATLQLTERRMR